MRGEGMCVMVDRVMGDMGGSGGEEREGGGGAHVRCV
jgi:hypothetical protein